MAHGVTRSDEIVAESRVDSLREGLPQGVGTDLGRRARDSRSGKSPLDRPPARRLGKTCAGPSPRKEVGPRRLVGQRIEIFLEGRSRLRVQRHVIAGAPALGCPSPDADPVLDLAGNPHITNAQGQHTGQPQAGMKAEHNQGPFPAPSRGGEEIEKTRNFGFSKRAATAHGNSEVPETKVFVPMAGQGESLCPWPGHPRPRPDHDAQFPDKGCVPDEYVAQAEAH